MPPEQGQGEDVQGGLRDQRADQDREGLAHPADAPGEDHRPAGSPSRAGRVADMRTPIIVAEVTSRRRTWCRGRAARAIAIQETARTNIAATIRAQAIRTQLEVRVDDARDDLVDADALRGERSQAEAENAGDRHADLAGRSPAADRGHRREWARARAGACAGRLGPPSMGTSPVRRAHTLNAAERRRGGLDRALVDLGDLARRPAARRSARRCGGRASPIAAQPLGFVRKQLELLGEAPAGRRAGRGCRRRRR